MFSLTTTHLRFVCEATTPLRLEADTFRAVVVELEHQATARGRVVSTSSSDR